MKNENFEEIISQLKLEKNKWLLFSDIDSIILKDGTGRYPNWRHLRFLIDDKNEIYIQHGKSEMYGARLSTLYSLSYDNSSISYNSGAIVLPDEINGRFRQPASGDIIRVGYGKNPCIYETLISSIVHGYNGCIIKLVAPIPKMNDDEYRFSFYDPKIYDSKSCIHGTEEEGIYMKFIPNSGKTHKIYGVFHEKINIKEISEINLKLKTDKTYSLK